MMPWQLSAASCDLCQWKHMFDEMQAEWFAYASDLIMQCQRQQDLPVSAQDLFEQNEDVANFLQCRAKFAMILFIDFLAGQDRVCEEGILGSPRRKKKKRQWLRLKALKQVPLLRRRRVLNLLHSA